MARKSSKRTTVAESNALKGKKSLGEPSRRSKRVQELKEAALKNPRLPQDSSSSDEIDEDYAEFLKTYRPEEDFPSVVVLSDSSSSDYVDEDYAEFLRTHNPQEFYHSGYTSEEEDGSLVTVEPKAKVTKSPRVQPPK
ncbi:hypothetical protein QL285_010865 [Trifolium repens]|jgi:hypothetical protein|nr:hypothetical protein QL285_010865 [Trifolium repens]